MDENLFFKEFGDLYEREKKRHEDIKNAVKARRRIYKYLISVRYEIIFQKDVLHKPGGTGKIEEVKKLLSEGADIHALDQYVGLTLLPGMYSFTLGWFLWTCKGCRNLHRTRSQCTCSQPSGN